MMTDMHRKQSNDIPMQQHSDHSWWMPIFICFSRVDKFRSDICDIRQNRRRNLKIGKSTHQPLWKKIMRNVLLNQRLRSLLLRTYIRAFLMKYDIPVSSSVRAFRKGFSVRLKPFHSRNICLERYMWWIGKTKNMQTMMMIVV